MYRTGYLKSLKVGDRVTLKIGSWLEGDSIRSKAYRIPKAYKNEKALDGGTYGDRKYRCRLDADKLELTIEVFPARALVSKRV